MVHYFMGTCIQLTMLAQIPNKEIMKSTLKKIEFPQLP